jgi:membrane protease YdiL (CAAX protease family)
VQLALLSLLLVVLALLVWRAVTRERREYAQFKRMRSTTARQKVYRKWLIESVLIMGGLSAVVLLAVWSYVPRVLAEAQAWPPVAALRDFLGTPLGVLTTVVITLLFLVGMLLPAFLLRNTVDEVPAIGDIRALLPRNNAELPYGAGLALSAGIFEETLFRLALPALLYGITGSAPIAFAGCAVLFGLLHLYQKVTGVIVAIVLGLALTLVYVVSGSILLAIAVHAIIDLRSLVLLPWVLNKRPTGAEERPEGASRSPSTK